MPAHTAYLKTPCQQITPEQAAATVEKHLSDAIRPLEKNNRFAEACDLLNQLHTRYGAQLDSPLYNRLQQRRSRCTYKNEDLKPQLRFQQALKILSEIEPLDSSCDAETLGQAGAIYKRRWQHEARLADLKQSLHYYQRGAAHESDGYCAINQAFLLERLATLEPEYSDAHQQQAAQIRSQLIRKLSVKQQPSWWERLTLAEACIGNARFDLAAQHFAKANALAEDEATDGGDNWQMATAVQQIGTLIQLKWPDPAAPERQQAEQTLEGFLPDGLTASSAAHGKIGLALSGGGFRASFFHLGVMARLAELNLLKRVEVLSCVSGGSIIGAAYYLELRELLQTKHDRDISQDDYRQLVENLSARFLQGVQTNIRTSLLASLTMTLRMLLPGYNRTHRLAELYEARLFQPAGQDSDTPLYINQLHIIPKDAKDTDAPFKPRYQNWQRSHKVPVMLLNTACLNTGHNWQFTVDWMGEAPWSIDDTVDANDQLAWTYYRDAPSQYQQFRLGEAVAASSGVPMLFPPLTLKNLYPGMNVRLVDGGVYDNQGIAGLLQQDCEHLLISDASGQLATDFDPAANIAQVPLRSSEIVQERLRNSQYAELRSRYQSGQLKSVGCLHLKKSLQGQQRQPAESLNDTVAASTALTDYQIHPDYQRALAAIRTDLDAFSDNEAHALMLSGYNMATRHLPEPLQQLAEPEQKHPWSFLRLKDAMQGKDPDRALLKQLHVAQHRFFKVWRLSPALSLTTAVMLLAVALSVDWLPSADSFLHWVNHWQFSVTGIGLCLLLLVLFSCPVTLLCLKVFDRLYLGKGKAPR